MNEPWDTQMMALGDFIRRQRKQANLSLRQLAEKTRLSNPYLSQIERGLHQPSMRVIKLISEALNVSAETLLTHAGILHSDSHGPTEGGSDGDGARSDSAQVQSDSAQVQSDSAQVQSDSAQVQSDSAQVRSNSAQVRWDATRGQLASNDGQADTPENAMSARANVQPARVPSVELAINSEARLSDRQKAALISVYQSMLRID